MQARLKTLISTRFIDRVVSKYAPLLYISLISAFTAIPGIINTYLYQFLYTRSFVVGQKWSIWGRYKLFIVAPGKMIVGSGFRCNSSQERAFFTLDGPSTFSVLGGDLVIGDNVAISGSSLYCTNHIAIGDRVMIAPGCIICDTDNHSVDYPSKRWSMVGKSKPISIESDVWLGARCMVFKGVRVGKGSVLAAGSIVTRDIPPGVLAAGAPATVVRALKEA